MGMERQIPTRGHSGRWYFKVSIDFEQSLDDELAKIREMLVTKNKSYGNSALDPVRIFSRSDPVEQLNVRIDDKISRIMQGGEYPGDDTELDLIGYLILKRIAIDHF